jgi:hypothetical protein
LVIVDLPIPIDPVSPIRIGNISFPSSMVPRDGKDKNNLDLKFLRRIIVGL